jgi:hypothetical protein
MDRCGWRESDCFARASCSFFPPAVFRPGRDYTGAGALFSYFIFIISSTPTKTLTMATSMAAAIAASLPAPQAASAPAAPVHEPIPASMSKLIDMEAEIPLNSVQLEGLVCPAVVAPHFACYRLWYYRSFRKSLNTAQNLTQPSTVYFSDWTSMVF